MALQTYNNTKHHIGLKEKGGPTLYGFTLGGGYRRQLQRESQRSVAYGGGVDLASAAPGVSRWNQDGFEGGAFQYRVGQDTARFSDSGNFVPQLQDRSAVSIPPMFLNKSFDPLNASYTAHIDLGVGSPGVPTYVEPKAMFPIAGSVYIVFRHGVFRWRKDTDALSFFGDANRGGFLNIVDGDYDQNEGVIYLLCNDPVWTGSVLPPHLYRLKTDLSGGATVAVYTAPTEYKGKNVHGMQLKAPGGHILVAMGLRLFTVLPPRDTSDASLNTKWTEVARLPGRWADSVMYNGRVYIGCNEADGETHIVAWDGTQLLPVTTMPFNFELKALSVYGGRLFAAGKGTDVNGGDRYAELHEITGASTRLVRTFLPEHYNQYAGADTPKNFKTICVDDGLLWMPHQGKKLVAYDLTADAFWGASEFQGRSSDFTIHKLTRGRGSLYGYGSRNGTNAETGLYRVAVPGDTVTSYKSWMTTSDFDVEIARDKRWSELVLHTRNAPTTTISYSVDSGASWTSLAGSTTTTTVNDLNRHVVNLSGIAPSKRIRFKFELDRGTTTTYVTAEIIAFSCSFLFLDNGKWAWNLTILDVENVEEYDGATVDIDLTLTATTLRGWAANKIALTFRDLDEVDHDVQIIDFVENQPIIAPKVGGELTESFFQVVLQEV